MLPEKIVLTLKERFTDSIARYLRQYGLEPPLCFRNSFNFIAGAVDLFGSQIVKGYQSMPYFYETAGQRRLHSSPCG